MLRIIYTLLLALAAPFLLYGLLRQRPGKPAAGKRWKEYFGVIPPLKTAGSPLWLHAVSVGEVIAAIPIIRALKQRHPERAIIVTTTTATGAEQVMKLGDLVEHRYMPVDFPFAIRGFISAVRPTQLLIMETELWPNTLHTVAKAGIPITVLNARLSERSCARYKKVQPVFNLLASNLSQLLCQHRDDAERFIRLGISSARVKITGSVKFDIQISTEIHQQGQQLRHDLGTDRPVWIAASTHEGEDEQLLEAHRQLLKQRPQAILILVPRHPERFTRVGQLAAEAGFNVVTRTSGAPFSAQSQVYIGDTMGEMLQLMSAADICFMAGSLIGDKVGGHNLLEPAALGKALLNGPSYFNFSDITRQLIQADAVQICDNPEQIAGKLAELLNDTTLAQQMGRAALAVVNKNRGALNKTLNLISADSNISDKAE